jgi:hypothetical protein
MNIYDQVIQLTSHMTLVEKVRLLEHLSTVLKQDIETEAYKRMPWDQFIDLTYGGLADDPIARNQPLSPDTRDEIE